MARPLWIGISQVSSRVHGDHASCSDQMPMAAHRALGQPTLRSRVFALGCASGCGAVLNALPGHTKLLEVVVPHAAIVASGADDPRIGHGTRSRCAHHLGPHDLRAGLSRWDLLESAHHDLLALLD